MLWLWEEEPSKWTWVFSFTGDSIWTGHLADAPVIWKPSTGACNQVQNAKIKKVFLFQDLEKLIAFSGRWNENRNEPGGREAQSLPYALPRSQTFLLYLMLLQVVATAMACGSFQLQHFFFAQDHKMLLCFICWVTIFWSILFLYFKISLKFETCQVFSSYFWSSKDKLFRNILRFFWIC